ncbi:MAG TPA: hypothetical protein DCQ98_04275 [Planctomycetaceae bacterium]|nr:hypothetical protein [Planctomycetaceae bacterium]HRF02486.1 hypothetical protein [Pirellulaceae bacterium]
MTDSLRSTSSRPFDPYLHRTSILSFGALAVLLLAGCGRNEPVRQVSVDKPKRVVGVLIADPERQALWSVFVAGPAPTVGRALPEVRSFLASWRFEAESPTPSWTAPDTWKVETAPEGTLAIFGLTPAIVGDDLKRSLPKEDPQRVVIRRFPLPPAIPVEEFVRSQFDRWGALVMAAELTDETFAACERSETAGLSTWWFDALGREPDRSARNAAGAVRTPPPAMTGGGRSDVDYRMPDGWRVSAAGSAIAAVTIETEGGEGTAQISVTQLTAASSWEENVQRWIGQVAADAMTDEQIRGATVEVPVDGTPSERIDLVSGAATMTPERLIAVRVVRGEVAWFVRMRGTAPRVESELAKFDEFLASLDLPD